MSVLNQLYNGEIHPEEDYKPVLSELIAARKEFVDHRDKLRAELEEPVRKKVLSLLEERTFLSSYEMEDAYVQGMKMGARMAVSLLGEGKRV